MASGTGPMKKKKKPAFSKTKAVAAKAKGTASRVAEKLNPFDAESKERRRQRKLKKTGKKAIARDKRAQAGKRAKGTGLISTKKGRAKAIGATADTQVRRGAVKRVTTKKGPDYVKYGKKTKAAKSFRSAFKAGCSGGAKSFSWDGRTYSCAKAGPKKAKKAIVRGGAKKSDPA